MIKNTIRNYTYTKKVFLSAKEIWKINISYYSLWANWYTTYVSVTNYIKFYLKLWLGCNDFFSF